MLNRAVQIFVTEKLGTRYFQTGGVNLKGVYEESDSTTPLILIHTHGEHFMECMCSSVYSTCVYMN